MNKTSYQVSDASIKRYWKLWESNRKKDDRKLPIELFNEWSDEENFSVYAHYDAMSVIAKDDVPFLKSIIFDYRETRRKLNKISEAFEIINELKA
tara:strand:+ start:481 stop:765 length:285 start_codon:yes stop_codon:yes gene_type:complete